MNYLTMLNRSMIFAGCIALTACGGSEGDDGNNGNNNINNQSSSIIDGTDPDQGGGDNGTSTGTTVSNNIDEDLGCIYNYERSACEYLAQESSYVESFITGRGNNCPSSVDPMFQVDSSDSVIIGDLGTCVLDGNRGPGGLQNFDELSGDPDDIGTVTTVSESNNNVTNWRLTDACSDGVGIDVRFHETINGQRTGNVWPGGSQVYVTEPGGTVNRNLSCNAGSQICFGAQPRSSSSTFWGIGVNGDQGCDSCCVSCGVDAAPLNLRC